MRIRKTCLLLSFALVACSGPNASAPGAASPKPEPNTRSSAPSTRAEEAPAGQKKGKSPEAQSFKTECKTAIKSARERKEALEGHSGDATVETVLEPLNGLWMQADNAISKASLYREVHPDAAVRQAANWCQRELKKLMTEISLSRPIYEAVSAVDTTDAAADTQRFVEHTLRDFRRAGVDNPEPVRQRIAKLKDELVRIGQKFGQNIREDVKAIELESADALAGLPQDYIDAHRPNSEGKIVITTDYPDYIPYMSYAQSDEHRLALYKKFRRRGYPENIEVLDQLIAKRHQLAQLLGYDHWAQYITADKMIGSAKAAAQFITKIDKIAKPRAQKDYAILLERLRKIDPEADAVGDWQKTYLQELVKQERFDYDPKSVRQYFPYEHVRDGVLELTSEMFGVRYEPVDMDTWHESVESFELWDGERKIGVFHLDMHPRDDKYKHAAAFTLRTGVSGEQLPEAALVCNFPKGKELMEHGQVETFFHEFGHLLHHLFAGDHRWIQLSGFSTEWDFVEAPSQLLEEWAWNYEVLQQFARSPDGTVIPADLVEKLRAARKFGKGLWVRHQMFYASVSLNYYNQPPQQLDTTQMLKELQREYSPFDYVPETFFQASFGHLDGYSAMYYTYMWSLVIAKDLFSRFASEGMLDPEVAQQYRAAVLAPGGSKDAAVMVEDFLGREYTFEAFAKWLNSGI